MFIVFLTLEVLITSASPRLSVSKKKAHRGGNSEAVRIGLHYSCYYRCWDCLECLDIEKTKSFKQMLKKTRIPTERPPLTFFRRSLGSLLAGLLFFFLILDAVLLLTLLPHQSRHVATFLFPPRASSLPKFWEDSTCTGAHFRAAYSLGTTDCVSNFPPFGRLSHGGLAVSRYLLEKNFWEDLCVWLTRGLLKLCGGTIPSSQESWAPSSSFARCSKCSWTFCRRSRLKAINWVTGYAGEWEVPVRYLRTIWKSVFVWTLFELSLRAKGRCKSFRRNHLAAVDFRRPSHSLSVVTKPHDKVVVW